MQSIFVFVSVLGVLFIIAMSGNLNSGGNLVGIAILMGAVVSGATYNILSRKLSSHYKPLEITFIMMWVGSIFFNMIAVANSIMEGTLHSYFSGFSSWQAVLSILYLGILSSICAFFMLNFMLSKLTASSSAVFSNLTTVISILAGVFIRHESFYWYQLAGGILIILGVWGTNYYGMKTSVEESITTGA
jgi:drug/metabolite transporter (DMT)-like permease